jgi:TolA-binding protein
MIGRVLAMAVLAVVAASAQTADVQFGFADSLHQSGDDAFAMLEFRRFVFLYPESARVPDAFGRMARLYVSHRGDVASAQGILDALIAKYPETPAAKEAAAFKEFIEVNSDFAGEPLKLWMAAESLEKQKAFESAVATYDTLLKAQPKARLADDALLRKGLLLRDHLGRAADAHAVLASLRQSYPQSELVARADFEAAVALSQIAGKEKDAVAAFRAFATAFPKDALAADALRQADVLEAKSFVIVPQCDKAFVKPFTVRKAETQENVYRVDVEVAVGLSQRELQATLEEALITEGAKRAAPRDQVVVNAYVNYPLNAAGEATWVPGQAPVYRVKEQQTGTVLRDIFIDILRKR